MQGFIILANISTEKHTIILLELLTLMDGQKVETPVYWQSV